MTDSRLALRKSGIELLRIVAAAGVIILHFVDKGYAAYPEFLNRLALMFCDVSFSWAVNLFVMVSGYFMVCSNKVSIRKPVELLLQLFVLRTLLFVFELVTGGAVLNIEGIVLLIIPKDYFIVLYCALLLLSPYINYIINSLDTKKLYRMFCMLFMVFCLYNWLLDLISELIKMPIAYSSTVGSNGSMSGQTIVNFVLCYMIGALIRKGGISIKRPLLVFAACVVAQLAMAALGVYFRAYTSPFVILQAAALLVAAERLEFRSRVVNVIAKASLSVYIIHYSLLVKIDIASIVYMPLLKMVLSICAIILTIYAVGFVLHYVYNALMSPLLKKIQGKLDTVEFSV